ncbi:MAG: nucleoside kinase [Clostridiales Family XIII bacterium]|jgi:uridine kinase|nr:nucleoside kinase [Clostridiales Family XIII bacterium]
MIRIKIRLLKDPGADPICRETEAGTTVEELLGEYRSHVPYRVMTARVNGDDVPLTFALTKDCEVIFCDIRDNTANRSFQRGLSLLYLKAVHDLFGDGARAYIRNSVNRGLFTTIEFAEGFPEGRKVNEEDLRLLEKHMWGLVDANLPIKATTIGKKELFDYLNETGAEEKLELLKNAPELKFITVCRLDGYVNYFYGIMPPGTGYVCPFALELAHGGVLLRFPHPSDPGRLALYRRDAKVFGAYEEEQQQLDALGLAYISDLNRQVASGSAKDIIRLAEGRHAARIESIAQKIRDSGKRIVLIAGPSSSGKTTFSKRLIEAIGMHGGPPPFYLGTDDYFVDREFAPRDRKGNFNFDGLGAMDVDLFADNINELLGGGTADIPTFDFMEGKKIFGTRQRRLQEGQIVVVEGIHALNKKMSVGIGDDQKFKIYISPLTQLNIDDHNRVPSTDVRLIRRMLRDNRTRGHSVADTIRGWPKVRAGESVNVFPYNNEADEIFNSTLVYELPVLKKYAMPLLEEIRPGEAEYGYAKWLLYFLSFFMPIEDESPIPDDSVLREFIGGGKFEA